MGGGGFGALPFLTFSSEYILMYLIGGSGIELILPSADAISEFSAKLMYHNYRRVLKHIKRITVAHMVDYGDTRGINLCKIVGGSKVCW
jgi:hypothetical protein